MPKLLEGHSRPIAQNIAATGIWELLFRGIPTLVTWYFAHQASIRGWAWPWVILAASVLFLLLSVGVHYFLTAWHQRRSGDAEGEAEQSETEKALILSESRAGTLEHKLTVAQSDLEGCRRVRAEVQTKLDQLQSRFNELHDESEETKWLRDIASDQAQTLHRFVHITEVRYGKCELMRSDPYINVILKIDNRSIYGLTLSEVGGSLSFAGRELMEERKWIERPQLLTAGDVALVTFRQRLTRDDVAYIVSGDAEDTLDFSKLEIRAGDGAGMVQWQLLHTHHLSLTNGVLIEGYPKLDIQIKGALYSWIYDARPIMTNESLLVTLLLTLKNQRHFTVAINTLKLTATINGKEFVAHAEGGRYVWPQRYITEAGTEGHQGYDMLNLNAAAPLTLVEEKPTHGALQFHFDDFPSGLVDEFGVVEVEAAPVELLLVDQEGERHRASCLLTSAHRAKGLSGLNLGEVEMPSVAD